MKQSILNRTLGAVFVSSGIFAAYTSLDAHSMTRHEVKLLEQASISHSSLVAKAAANNAVYDARIAIFTGALSVGMIGIGAVLFAGRRFRQAGP